MSVCSRSSTARRPADSRWASRRSASLAVTNENMATPATMTPTATARPAAVFGAMSPYPTVARVTTLHQSASPNEPMTPSSRSNR